MKEFSFTFEPNIPEQVKVSFISTGSQGGDAGHGGEAVLLLSMTHGGDGMTVSVDGETTDGAETVRISVGGDWELEGLAVAFLELGKALLVRRWEEEDEPKFSWKD